MNQFKTEQEQFWAESFGDQYIDRNSELISISKNIALFSKILQRNQGINSAIEFGSNIGLNLLAINKLLPNVELSAIEINKKAIDKTTKIGGVR
jgi:spore coat polysaccharide biosynthesis protein SpsF